VQTNMSCAVRGCVFGHARDRSYVCHNYPADMELIVIHESLVSWGCMSDMCTFPCHGQVQHVLTADAEPVHKMQGCWTPAGAKGVRHLL
jgi:hypothetical protein